MNTTEISSSDNNTIKDGNGNTRSLIYIKHNKDSYGKLINTPHAGENSSTGLCIGGPQTGKSGSSSANRRKLLNKDASVSKGKKK